MVAENQEGQVQVKPVWGPADGFGVAAPARSAQGCDACRLASPFEILHAEFLGSKTLISSGVFPPRQANR